MQTVRKYLVYEYVPIMEKTFRSGTRESCVAQRSIYVILRGNEETRRYINQVRNVLKHLMSVRIYEFILIKCSIFRAYCFVWHSLKRLWKDRNIGCFWTKQNTIFHYLSNKFFRLLPNRYNSTRWQNLCITQSVVREYC